MKAFSISIKKGDDPRIVHYSSLKGKALEKEGVFIAEGEKVVKAMLESGCRMSSCLASRSAPARYKAILSKMAKRGIPVYLADDSIIEDIIGFRFHRGIMAIGHCPEKSMADGFVKTITRPLFLVALDSVNDPQNVGLIVRSAAAFGAQAIMVDKSSYDPYYRRAVRNSMGAVFKLPVLYENDLAYTLKKLRKECDIRIIVATPGRTAGCLDKTDLSGDICLVFGNEDKGVSRKISAVADSRVRIPIAKNVDSLNVASAAAVCLYEASCQRKDL